MAPDVTKTDRDVRVRSPADVLRLVVAAVSVLAVILAERWFGATLVGFAADVLAGLSAVPEWMLTAFLAGTRIAAVALLLFGLGRAVVHHGWIALSTMLAALVLGGLLWWLLRDVAVVDPGAEVLPSLPLGPLSSGWFPTAGGVVAVAALLSASAPWLSRGWRRVGSLAVLGLVVDRFLASPISFDSVRAVSIGWLAGCATLVVLGAPLRRPTADGIADGMAAIGLPLASISAAKVDARGSTPYFATGADGGALFVKVLSRDERSADLLFRLYRRIQRHDLGDERPFSSLRRAVEHEAFVALAARDLGVQTPRLRAVATVEPGAIALAYDSVDGRSLDRVSAAELTDEVLAGVWSQMAILRRHRIAHRDLRLANLFLGADGTVWLIDFGFSEVAASDLLMANDVAELVASSSVVVGVDRAVTPALAVVDAESRRRAAERLQPWALSGATRTALKQHPGLLDDLRTRLAAP